jgi:hypothetical protein
MRCRSRNKVKHPTSKPPDFDDELAELASVIAEYQIDNNAYGWFIPPWRNGWNAVELAVRAAEIEGPVDDEWLLDVVEHRGDRQDVYWTAQDRLAWGATSNRLLRAAYRCLQVLIAKSDGGGEVYNAILVEPFSKLMPEQVEDLVLEYRCRDAINVSSILAGDVNDRQRRAFVIAWERGLYMAAYSIPPVVEQVRKKP